MRNRHIGNKWIYRSGSNCLGSECKVRRVEHKDPILRREKRFRREPGKYMLPKPVKEMVLTKKKSCSMQFSAARRSN